MPKELGPNERKLREMREARFGRSGAKAPTVTELRKVVAKVAARKKPKGRKR